MARLFVTERELDLFSDLTKELIKDVAGQEITYFAVNIDKSNVDELYNESDKKITDTPIKIECLVNWQEQETKTTQFGVDRIYSIEVFIHDDDLNDKNIKIREGDFIYFSDMFFEILSKDNPDLIYGMSDHKVMTKLVCKSARKGQFSVDGTARFDPAETFTQVAGKDNDGDRRELVKDEKIERILPTPGVTSPFDKDSDY